MIIIYLIITRRPHRIDLGIEKTNASKHKPVIAQVMTHKKRIRYT